MVVSLVVTAAASGAWAQTTAESRAEPWRAPVDQTGSQVSDNKDRTTSGEGATQPSAAEQRAARNLASAVFAKAGAAQRAAEKAAPEQTPDLGAVQPKPEWTGDKSGVGVGGKGVEIKQPF
jgi:hypothetical protein